MCPYAPPRVSQVRMTDECAAGMVAVQAGDKPAWAKRPVVFPKAQ